MTRVLNIGSTLQTVVCRVSQLGPLVFNIFILHIRCWNHSPTFSKIRSSADNIWNHNIVTLTLKNMYIVVIYKQNRLDKKEKKQNRIQYPLCQYYSPSIALDRSRPWSFLFIATHTKIIKCADMYTFSNSIIIFHLYCVISVCIHRFDFFHVVSQKPPLFVCLSFCWLQQAQFTASNK